MKIPNNPGAGELGYEPVMIKDEDGYEFDSFVTPDHYKKYLQRVLIPNGLIKSRVERMAFDISKTYNGEEFHLLCLLKGSRSFFTLLLKYLDRIHTYYIEDASTNTYREHYVRVKSYCNTQSTGRLEIVSEDLSCLKGKNVLIVEDIIDTGNTLSKFCDYLKKFEPKTIAISALYIKRTPLWNGFKADFTGFSVPNFFLVGCGLDYNENFRDLNHVCIIADDGIKAFMQPSS